MTERVLIAAVLGLFATAGFAQQSVLEEITVTAQKRAQDLQDVSVAVTAFTGDAIEKMGFEEGLDITQQVPNMNFFAIFGEASSPSIGLRGISLVNFSDSWESPVALYVDEVYRGNPAGSAIQLFDLERVEVLRGPQGTLYGRNTTGGLVHYISRNPTEEPVASASLRLGTYSERILEGMVSGPLSDRVRGRVAVKYNKNDGWQTNHATVNDLGLEIDNSRKLNETDNLGYRAKLDIDIGAESGLLLDVHGSTADQQSVGFAFMGYQDPGDGSRCSIDRIQNGECTSVQTGALAGITGQSAAGGNWDPEHVASSASEGLATKIDTFGVSARLTVPFDAFDLTSITAWETLDKFMQDDGDGTAAVWFDEQYSADARQFTQELRLNGATDTSNWVAGFYFYDDSRDLVTGAPTTADEAPFGVFHREDVALETLSWAVFGQFEYDLTDEFTLITGLRYTDEDRDFDYLSGSASFGTPNLAVTDDLSEEAVTGRIGLDWRPFEDTLVYGSFATGFKSGGFSGSYNQIPEAFLPVNGEDITNVEVGLKSTFADGRARLNMAAFAYEVEDFQAQVFLTVANGSQITNAGDVSGRGMEAELFFRPTENFELIAGVGLLDTEISSDISFPVAGTEFSLDDNETPSAPELTYNVVGRYYLPLGDRGEMVFQADYAWQDDHFLQIENDPFSHHDSYGIANARIGWYSPEGRFSVEVFAENLGDEEYFTYQNTLGGDWGYAVWGKPRTTGVRFIWKM